MYKKYMMIAEEKNIYPKDKLINHKYKYYDENNVLKNMSSSEVLPNGEEIIFTMMKME